MRVQRVHAQQRCRGSSAMGDELFMSMSLPWISLMRAGGCRAQGEDSIRVSKEVRRSSGNRYRGARPEALGEIENWLREAHEIANSTVTERRAALLYL